MSIGTRIVQGAAAAASHPDKTISVNGTEKVVGGGASVHWTAAGNMLTSTAPVGVTGWSASAKDHIVADPSELVAYAVALNDPNDKYDVVVIESTSAIGSHPTASARVPPNYAMVGGGCKVNWQADPAAVGSLLTASFPGSADTWECRAKDHEEASPATVTAYAIGIRPRDPATPMPRVRIEEATGPAAAHPEVQALATRPNAVVTCGGARANADYANGAAGQLITRSAPTLDATGKAVGWVAGAKDHITSSLGTITAFVISADLAAPDAGSIDDYVRRIPPLPRPSTVRAAVQDQEMDIGGIAYNLRQEAVRLVKNTEYLKLLDAIPEDAIYPGAILQATSISDGRFRGISLERAEGRIVIGTDLVAGNPGPVVRVATVASPDMGTVTTARENLLNGINPTGSAGSLLYDARTANTLEEGFVKFGIAFKPEAFTFDTKVNFDTSYKTNTAIIQMFQRFYSVSFLPGVGGASAFFTPSVTLDDVKEQIASNDPAIYVSTVHYGRCLTIIVESQASKTNFDASVALAVKALNGTATLEGQYKNIMDTSRIRILEKGADGLSKKELFVTGNTFLERVDNYAKSGANFSQTNRGAPVAAEFRYLGTRDVMSVALATNFMDGISLGAPDVSGTTYITDGWRPHGGPKETGVQVAKGDKIVVRAEGINWSGHWGSREYDANGHPQLWWIGDPISTAGFPLPDADPFCLIAGFDKTDWVFAGTPNTITANYPGDGLRTLWFGTNDVNPYDGDNARKFTVNYTVIRRKAEELGYNGIGRSSDT